MCRAGHQPRRSYFEGQILTLLLFLVPYLRATFALQFQFYVQIQPLMWVLGRNLNPKFYGDQYFENASRPVRPGCLCRSRAALSQ